MSVASIDMSEIAGNAAAVYLMESLQTGTFMPEGRNVQQGVRAAAANAMFQAGFLVPTIAKVLSGFGVQETVAIQGVFQGLAMGFMDQLMKRDGVGYQMSLIQGVAGAYAGNALGKSIKPVNPSSLSG